MIDRLGSLSLEGARNLPWHWTKMLEYGDYIKGIYEATALDPEGLVAPKELWFTAELKDWYKSREELRKQQ